MIPTLIPAADQTGAESPVHHRLKDGRLVGSGPPQIGRTQIGPVGDRRPRADEGGVTLLGDAELIVPRPVPDAVQHGEGGWGSLGPVLAQRPHRSLVGRVEVDDDRIDPPAIDPPGVVDLLDEELDGLRLLSELGILGESLLPGQRVEGHHREDDIDARFRHPPGRGARRRHRARSARRRAGTRRAGSIGRSDTAPPLRSCAPVPDFVPTALRVDGPGRDSAA